MKMRSEPCWLAYHEMEKLIVRPLNEGCINHSVGMSNVIWSMVQPIPSVGDDIWWNDHNRLVDE